MLIPDHLGDKNFTFLINYFLSKKRRQIQEFEVNYGFLL